VIKNLRQLKIFFLNLTYVVSYFLFLISYYLLFIPYYQQFNHNISISNSGGKLGVAIFSIAIPPLRGATFLSVFSANIIERHPSLLAERGRG